VLRESITDTPVQQRVLQTGLVQQKLLKTRPVQQKVLKIHHVQQKHLQYINVDSISSATNALSLVGGRGKFVL
jgi:hypothetical protein